MLGLRTRGAVSQRVLREQNEEKSPEAQQPDKIFSERLQRLLGPPKIPDLSQPVTGRLASGRLAEAQDAPYRALHRLWLCR